MSLSEHRDEGSGNKEPQELRGAFQRELEELKLQVEMMALRVDRSLRLATEVLLTGDPDLADAVVVADDEIDQMLVSLTERCYDLLCRQNPVASDLRLVVSVLRILTDLERTGDLCLRIVKLAPDHPHLAANEDTFSILRRMATEAVEMFRLAHRAWSTLDLELARGLDARDEVMDDYNIRLTEAIVRFEGEGAVPQAVKTLLAGRALERIADHCVMVGERLSYMVTGDLRSIQREIGPRE